MLKISCKIIYLIERLTKVDSLFLKLSAFYVYTSGISVIRKFVKTTALGRGSNQRENKK